MKKFAYLIFGLFILYGCNSGSTTPTVASTLTVNTYNYNPGNKTGVNITIGNGNTLQAEIDTGSDMTVVNESAIGPDVIVTSESLSMTYGGGTNTVSGHIGYGSVAFTASNGTKLISSPNTPLLVVDEGSVNQGGGNDAILGMRMNNQVSVRLYLPNPYNQMMILNRPLNQITFGQLNQSQLNNFANIQQVTTTCINYGVSVTVNNSCWDLADSAINYTVTDTHRTESTYNYHTILDSGEANATFYFSPAPSWMNYESVGLVILNPITVTANTDKGLIPLPLTSQTYYQDNPGNTVNPGNNLFNYYQVLFDQTNGIIGFQNSNIPL